MNVKKWWISGGCLLLISGMAFAQQQQQQKQQDNIPDAPSATRPVQQVPLPPVEPTPLPPSQQVPPSSDDGTAPPSSSSNSSDSGPSQKPPVDEKFPFPEDQPPSSNNTSGASQPKTPVNLPNTDTGESGPSQDLYKITHVVNQVIIPVRVTDNSGGLENGLLAKDFRVYENGVEQKMNFFTSDPFALSVAVVIDLGMPDVALQKVNKTFTALEGAFSQFDEVAVYTYSSAVGDVSDFSGLAGI